MTRIALTVAGSDSGGGAGIQGDLKTFARWGVFGTSVITAITAQNTLGVRAWEPVSTALIRAQLDAVFDDLPPDAMKTGMLGTADVARAVVHVLTARHPSHVVVDPVMVATSGDALSESDTIAVMRDLLLPCATLVTPNLAEAGVLLDAEIVTLDDMREAAQSIVTRFGARAALVKGGHAAGDEVCDVLYDGAFDVIRHPRIASDNTHGTGCALSAAITAQLALGAELRAAVRTSVAYVSAAIASAPPIGSGHGPINHSA